MQDHVVRGTSKGQCWHAMLDLLEAFDADSIISISLAGIINGRGVGNSFE